METPQSARTGGNPSEYEADDRSREQAASLLLRLSGGSDPRRAPPSPPASLPPLRLVSPSSPTAGGRPSQTLAQLGDRPFDCGMMGRNGLPLHHHLPLAEDRTDEAARLASRLPPPPLPLEGKLISKRTEVEGPSARSATVPMSIDFLLNNSGSRSPSPTTNSTTTQTTPSPPSPSPSLPAIAMDDAPTSSSGRLPSHTGRRSPPPLPSLQLPLVFPEVARRQRSGPFPSGHGLHSLPPPLMPSSPPTYPFGLANRPPMGIPPSPPPLSPASCSSPSTSQIGSSTSTSVPYLPPPPLGRSAGVGHHARDEPTSHTNSDNLQSLLAPVIAKAGLAANLDPHQLLPFPQQARSASQQRAPGGPPVPSMQEGEALRLRREVHLQRQRKLLLQLLQEKQKEIEGKWGHADVSSILPTDDMDGYVVDDGILQQQHPLAQSGSGRHAHRRAPLATTANAIVDGLHHMDGASDGVDGSVEVLGPKFTRSAATHQHLDRYQPHPLLRRSEPRGGENDWKHRDRPYGDHSVDGRREEVTPDTRIQVPTATKDQPRGSLNELEDEEDYKGTNFTSSHSNPQAGLMRLYGGSNLHRGLDDSARRRRRPSYPKLPTEGKPTDMATHPAGGDSQARRRALDYARDGYDREQNTEGGLDAFDEDNLSSRFYRSAMNPPRLSPTFRSYLQERSQQSNTESTTQISDGGDSKAPSEAKDVAPPTQGSGADSIATVVSPTAIGASAPEDNSNRKRASPEQMQMLQKILSYYEQSPQRIEELERITSIPIRRRKRRSDSTAPVSSPNDGASGETPSASEGGAADGETTTENQSSAGSQRKRRKRDRDVLIFHHMKVQDDGKMMMVQRS